jgi:cobalt-precorrin 5A hydrolase/precorrin-3B C17-methyltransferase
MPSSLITLALSGRGVRLAGRLRAQLGGDLIAPARHTRDLPTGGEHGRAVSFGVGGVRSALDGAFGSYRSIVLISPVGLAVRLLAPLLGHKESDPAVVVLDEAGRHAVSLLSGHAGGANELARAVAAAVGADPVITTTSDLLGMPALDLLGAEHGWSLEQRASLTRASAALLDGRAVGAFQDAGEEDWWRDAPDNLARYASIDELLGAEVDARIVVSDREHALTADVVLYRPRTLAIGVGCVRGVSANEIEALAEEALAQQGRAPGSVRCLATHEVKRDEPGLIELAERRGWPVRFFSAAELASVVAPSGASPLVEAAVGAGAVCEPAALLASEGGDLVAPKAKTARVTVAVAQVRRPSGGAIAVVGLGPGSLDDLTGRARAALEAADVLVGYRAYLDQIRPWLGSRIYLGRDIGEEVERCRLAVELARAGRRVALVSSGDAGIYGMAGLLLEVLDDERAAGLQVEVIPGITAAQSAGALLGAPLMSDFAAISLSDLLTPWSVIERRLEAVAIGDLVVALYNPASQRRRDQLGKAQEILLRHRAAETPVGIVRNAGRPGQAVVVSELGRMHEEAVDMLTIVLVGCSATERIGDWLVTRRGYPRPTAGSS